MRSNYSVPFYIGARGLWKCVMIGQSPDLSDLHAGRMHPQAWLNSYNLFLNSQSESAFSTYLMILL